MKYRIVKTDSNNPYRVQERRPLWASFFIPYWEFVIPYRWHPTLESAQRALQAYEQGRMPPTDPMHFALTIDSNGNRVMRVGKL